MWQRSELLRFLQDAARLAEVSHAQGKLLGCKPALLRCRRPPGVGIVEMTLHATPQLRRALDGKRLFFRHATLLPTAYCIIRRLGVG